METEDERWERLRRTPYPELPEEDKKFLDAGSEALLEEIMKKEPHDRVDDFLPLSGCETKDAPFSIVRRYRTPDGVVLVFRHDKRTKEQPECGKEAALVFSMTEDLKSRYPIECACGLKTEMYFSNPKMGRRLLEALRNELPEDRVRGAENPPEN